MIATATHTVASGKLLFNWFDVALICVVFFGFWRGRKNGMTKEFVPLLQWLTTVIAAGLGYAPLGDLLIKQGFARGLRDFLQTLKILGDSINEKTAGYVTAYLGIVVVLLIIFSLFKLKLKARLEGSQMFGSTEYYFGMVAGVLRYFCMVLFALALLNAPNYTQVDIQRQKFSDNRWLGGGLQGYSGDYIPHVYEVQTSIFKDSLAGPFLKDNLGILLVTTTGPNGTPAKTPVISIGQ
jgi:uncharacterized membrane protein required for colicin V production